MSKQLTRWVVWSLSTTFAGSAFAQTEPPAEPAPAADASGSMSMSTEGATTSADASATPPASEDTGFDPYKKGLPPENNMFEMSIFSGAIIPSTSNNWRYEAYPHREFSAGPEFGARLGYYPLSFVGVEAEAMAAGSKIKHTDTAAAIYALRGQLVLQAPLPHVAPFILVGAGRLGAISQATANDTDPAWHFGVGAKIPLNHTFGLRIDLRDNITRNFQQDGQAQTFEMLLGISASAGRTRKEPPGPAADTDHDGFIDAVDQCPNDPGVAPNGCPADTDGDGVLDRDDYCPREAGPAPKGCPIVDLDPDKDGIPVPCDMCPNEKGVAPDGCPIRDTDGDGIPDDKDKCPKEPETKNGFEDDDGCPDKIPEAVRKFTGVIQGIYFDKAKATIRPDSATVLGGAAKVLAQFPSIRIEISGHTSSEGELAFNEKLSQDRADAVKAWLVNKGVPSDRITTRGAGPSEPIADNKTSAGREKNRRIEFKILTQ